MIECLQSIRGVKSVTIEGICTPRICVVADSLAVAEFIDGIRVLKQLNGDQRRFVVYSNWNRIDCSTRLRPRRIHYGDVAQRVSLATNCRTFRINRLRVAKFFREMNPEKPLSGAL